MSFNKKYLPELPELVKIRESYSSDQEFLENYLRKVDALMGSQESFEYLDKIKQRVKNEQELGSGSGV
jgi:hypothetical protein